MPKCSSTFLEVSSLDQINRTKNGLEYDWKNSHQRTLTMEHDRKFTPKNINLQTWPKYGYCWSSSSSIISLTPVRDVKMTVTRSWIRHFRGHSIITPYLDSHVKVRHCGNIYYIFLSSSKVNIHQCKFFGHVHRFWSYSFGHLDSVMWVFLLFFPAFNLFLVKSIWPISAWRATI